MKTNRQKGSVLLITLTLVLILAIASASILELSTSSYKLSMRNQYRADASAVAESELEYMLYRFKSQVMNNSTATFNASAANQAVSALGDIAEIYASTDTAPYPTQNRTVFLQAHQSVGWTVRRSMQMLTTISGRIPNTTKIGLFTYVIARVEVVPPTTGAFSGIATVRVGRRFINSNTSIFQNSIFFQGDLELNPGNNTTINGDISANGSIYMGPASGRTLTLNGTVRYLNYFNADATHTTGVYSNPNAPTPPVTLVAPTFGPTGTLENMTAAENLLNGLDAAAAAVARPDLFAPAGASSTDASLWTAAQLATATNSVYRSMIAPPPSASTSNEYPNAPTSTVDDSVISALRAYTKAGLIITVSPTNTVKITQVQNGVSTDVTASYPSSIVAATTNSWDEREGKTVAVTTIDVGALKTQIEANYTSFNGVLYVNLQNSSSSTPAAIKLTNAASLPIVNPTPANTDTITGFSVATNGGLYVQGSYNTTPIVKAGSPDRAVPAMLMGDAVTVLSSSYVDSAVSRPITSRVASISAAEIATRVANLSTAQIATITASLSPAETAAIAAGTTTLASLLPAKVAASGVQINAGLLTGNTASTGSIGNSSGGAQNLVRYMENWSGQTINYSGSIGRLFQSTQLTAPYTGPGTIYIQPTSRVFSFDSNMQSYAPPATPTTTEFSRGTYFTW